MSNLILPRSITDDIKFVNHGYNPNGTKKHPRLYAVGSYFVTKGHPVREVMCWEGKPGRREVGSIGGYGEVIEGPDEVDRYLCQIKGCKVWISAWDMLVKGRGLPRRGQEGTGIVVVTGRV